MCVCVVRLVPYAQTQKVKKTSARRVRRATFKLSYSFLARFQFEGHTTSVLDPHTHARNTCTLLFTFGPFTITSSNFFLSFAISKIGVKFQM